MNTDDVLRLFNNNGLLVHSFADDWLPYYLDVKCSDRKTNWSIAHPKITPFFYLMNDSSVFHRHWAIIANPLAIPPSDWLYLSSKDISSGQNKDNYKAINDPVEVGKMYSSVLSELRIASETGMINCCSEVSTIGYSEKAIVGFLFDGTKDEFKYYDPQILQSLVSHNIEVFGFEKKDSGMDLIPYNNLTL